MFKELCQAFMYKRYSVLGTTNFPCFTGFWLCNRIVKYCARKQGLLLSVQRLSGHEENLDKETSGGRLIIMLSAVRMFK